MSQVQPTVQAVNNVYTSNYPVGTIRIIMRVRLAIIGSPTNPNGPPALYNYPFTGNIHTTANSADAYPSHLICVAE